MTAEEYLQNFKEQAKKDPNHLQEMQQRKENFYLRLDKELSNVNCTRNQDTIVHSDGFVSKVSLKHVEELAETLSVFHRGDMFEEVIGVILEQIKVER